MDSEKEALRRFIATAPLNEAYVSIIYSLKQSIVTAQTSVKLLRTGVPENKRERLEMHSPAVEPAAMPNYYALNGPSGVILPALLQVAWERNVAPR